MSQFEKALAFVLKWEGDLTDPSPGYDGDDETHHGIDESKNPDLEVETLTDEQIRQIYKERYWDKLNCDSFYTTEAMIIFDSGVNCGVERTQGWITEADQKGWREILLLRIAHYTKLANNKKYKPYFLGWMNRVVDLYKTVNDNV